jgi:DNA-binding XRE family transcriptional regulator
LELPPTLDDGIRANMSKTHAGDVHPLSPAEFGRRVVRFRKRKKLRQVDLAARVGLHRADLCKIEKGRGPENPSSSTILRFAEALGVTPNDLMV